jgi:hypothetical protein
MIPARFFVEMSLSISFEKMEKLSLAIPAVSIRSEVK